jgi:thioredoxin-like negative regulator of GroEL
LAPDWEKLAETFAESDKYEIAEVDCDEHKNICGEQGVQGFPTIKAYPAGSADGEMYEGGRSYDDLKAFVDGGALNAVCSSVNKDSCTKEDLKELEDLEKLGENVVGKRIAEREAAMKEADELFKALSEKLQAEFKAAHEANEKAKADNKAPLKKLKRVSFPGVTEELSEKCNCCKDC